MLNIVTTLIPLLLMVAIGYVFRKKVFSETKTLSNLVLYIFSPALVFSNLIGGTVTPIEIMEIALFSMSLTIVLSVMSKILAHALGYSKEKESALMISTVFLNSVNYGGPVILFALGPAGLERALVYGITQGITLYSFGVYCASMGKASWRSSLVNMFKLPMIYAAILAGVINLLAIPVTGIAFDVAAILGDAAIPLMLVLLGIQLGQIGVKKAYGFIALSSSIRLVLSPLIGILLLSVLGVHGLLAKVLILQSAMPMAVMGTVLSMKFDARPDLVSSSTLFATIFSVVTLTILISILI